MVPKSVEYRRISGDSKTIVTELEKYLLKSSSECKMDTHLEINFKFEDGINIQEKTSELISMLAEKNVYVASWKRQNNENLLNRPDFSFYQDEVRNLNPEEIFKILILSKNPVGTEGLDEKQIKEKQQAVLEKYLPLFNQVYSETEQKGLLDENN